MTVDVRHAFSIALPDALDPTIAKPSHWNAPHPIKADGPCVLGVIGTGAAQTVVEVTPAGGTPLGLFWNGANIVWGLLPTGVLADGSVTTPKLADGAVTTIKIADDAVTFAKMQNIATDRLIGRDTAGTGDPEEISLNATLEFTGGQQIRRAALTGDVTSPAGSNAMTIPNDTITNAHLRNSAALSVIGRDTNSVGDPADIAAGADDTILRRVASALSWGGLTLNMAGANLWTYAKLQQVAASRLLGNPTGGAANVSEIGLTGGLEFSGANIQIANDAITFAKFQNITSDRLIGRDTAASGDPEEIALDSTLEFTGSQSIRRAALSGAVAASAGSNTTTSIINIIVVIGDGVNVITTGVKGFFPLDIAGTITGWTLIADASGSIVIDVWKDTYANSPPTVADTIAGSEKPTLSSVQKNQDLSLSTWTTGISAQDVLGFNVDSATTVKQVTLSIRVTKTG